MKKLALVLGSLLVVGTAVSAKEVMPAPVAAPEKVVEIVEKPVIVYRDREVTPAWRPSGSVTVETRTYGNVEGHKGSEADRKPETDWKGSNYYTQLRTTTEVNFTENQTLKIYNRHDFKLQRRDGDNQKAVANKETYLKHTYNFGNLGSSKVNARLESKFGYKGGETEKYLDFKPIFDFSEYFFKNDYVKATALEIGPSYRHTWSHDDVTDDQYGVYANAEFALPYSTTFQAEFDNAYQLRKAHKTEHNEDSSRVSRTGQVELTLANEALQYKTGAHRVALHLETAYGTGWSYARNNVIGNGYGDWSTGEQRSNGSFERWGAYQIKLEPAVVYSFKPTDFVTLYTRVGGEYKNRTQEQSHAKHWRWQPYARVGMKVTF